ncbi:toll-like receptor 4 [Babylonia areolata]|uniref:toll-like receptor 4 n=1 Tax=Babylonia areolata TaxID=304850 RepID=UPI003FD552CF
MLAGCNSEVSCLQHNSPALTMMKNIVTSVLTLLTLVALTLARDVSVAMATSNCTFIRSGSTVVSADCSHRGWTQVPRTLPPTLLSLDLSGNQLVTLPERPFRRYHLLESLDLSENQIIRLENATFSGLGRLRWLSLRMNGLRMKPGVFPDDAFWGLTQLRYLDLHLNQPQEWNPDLAYPDAALSSLPAMRTLKMDGLATNVDLGPGFSKLHCLEVLDINDVTGNCVMTVLSEKFFFHINTSRPLTVNLTDCKLRTIHNNTFSFLPTLHTLDLNSVRSLSFLPFMQASRSLQWTQIKVLDISGIHGGANIKIRAEYFRYLGYTWLERLIVSSENAYDIDLRAMFNLPTSLKYLSFYDNKLINATFLFGLYLLPHMDTIQVSRQNHFTSEVLSDYRQNHNKNNVDLDSQIHLDNKKRRRYDYRVQNNKNLTLVSNRSKTAQIYSPHTDVELNSSTKRSQKPRALDANKLTRNEMSAPIMQRHAKGAVLHAKHKFLKQEKPYQFMFENRKGTPLFFRKNSFLTINSPVDKKYEIKQTARRLKTTSPGHLPDSPSDPDLCFNPRFTKMQESRMRAFLGKLKSFLVRHNIHISQTTQSLMLPVRNRTSPEDLLRATHNNSQKTRSTDWADVQDDYWPLPPTIRHVYASELKLGYTLPRLRFFDNQVQTLDVSKNNLPCFIGPFFGLHQLRTLDLSNNFAVYLSQDFFEDMPRLTHLYLQGNFLGDSFNNDSSGQIFSGLKSLKVLDLNDNSIKHLSARAFQAQKHLTRLSLARNALSKFKPSIAHMAALTFLDLSENSVPFLQREVLNDLDTIFGVSNLTIDLHKNPLSCGCEALEFWGWVTQGAGVHFQGVGEYTCTLANGTEIGYETVKLELDTLRLQCQGTEFLAVAVGLLVALLFLLSLLGVLHYKRWHLRYFYYVGLRRLRHPYDHHHALQNVADDVKDVFISFDDDSGDFRVKQFVHEVLQPELDRQGLTYYTSEAQFAARPIKDIITEAILGARKTLAIFSADFFPSYERELEFNMAVYHEEKIHRQVIVPAVMGPIDWSVFPPEVRVYLEEHTCALHRQNEDEVFARILVGRIRADVRL